MPGLWNAFPREACLASSQPFFQGLLNKFLFMCAFNLRDWFYSFTVFMNCCFTTGFEDFVHRLGLLTERWLINKFQCNITLAKCIHSKLKSHDNQKNKRDVIYAPFQISLLPDWPEILSSCPTLSRELWNLLLNSRFNFYFYFFGVAPFESTWISSSLSQKQQTSRVRAGGLGQRLTHGVPPLLSTSVSLSDDLLRG